MVTGFAGLTTTSVPVKLEGRVIAFLHIGQVFLRTPSAKRFKKIADCSCPTILTRFHLSRKVKQQNSSTICAVLEPPLHMPGFKDMLTSDQLNDLVAYLFSLKPKGEEAGF